MATFSILKYDKIYLKSAKIFQILKITTNSRLKQRSKLVVQKSLLSERNYQFYRTACVSQLVQLMKSAKWMNEVTYSFKVY